MRTGYIRGRVGIWIRIGIGFWIRIGIGFWIRIGVITTRAFVIYVLAVCFTANVAAFDFAAAVRCSAVRFVLADLFSAMVTGRIFTAAVVFAMLALQHSAMVTSGVFTAAIMNVM